MPEGDTPKSHTGDMDWVKAPDLLDTLGTGFIFVGLNCADTHGDQSDGGKVAWKNFHSDYSRQNDYKIRYALKGTRYWGSYITDIIKRFPEVDSSKVRQYLKSHPEVVETNIQEFIKEISLLGENPVLVAFGDEVYRILTAHLGDDYRIAKVPHYSHYIGKEEYRKQVLNKLKGYRTINAW